jgi:hypothetical protein
MLSKISWSEFIWFLIFLLVPYYLFVLTFYFRKEILSYMGKTALSERSLMDSQSLAISSTQDDMSFSAIHDLLEDLKNLFAVALKTRMVKDELVQSIQSRLKGYPNLAASDLREDISNHIQGEAKTVCGIWLDNGDLQRLWHP